MLNARQKENLVVVAAYVATVLLSLRMFFGIGVTTDDDFQYFLTARTPFSNWMTDAQIYAHGAGRFYFLVTKVFYYVPYLFDSFVWTKAVQYITLMVCYGMFAYTVARMLRSRGLGALVLLLLVWGLSVTPNMHMPTIAYPFYFAFSTILFMAGLLLYLRYTERGGYWRVWLSAIVMLVCFLFYETYLIYAFMFAIAIMAHHRFRLGDKTLWRDVLPLAGMAVLYVGCYFGYRQYLLASTPDLVFYDGSSFDPQKFSFKGFVNIVLRCTRGALPTQNYFGNKELIAANSLLEGGHSNGLMRVFTHASALVWITALLQTALLWWITGRRWFAKLSWWQVTVGLVVSVVGAFAAHLLVAVATKYNGELSSCLPGYVTTFYSYLFVMLAIALVIVASFKVFGNGIVVRGVWAILFLMAAVITGYANEHIAREWHKSGQRMEIIDRMAQEGCFDRLPHNAIVYTGELHNTPGMAFLCSYQTHDIEHYINLRAGRVVSTTDDTNTLVERSQLAPDAPVYYLHAQCSPKGADMLVAMARLDSTLTTANEADVFYLSPAKSFDVYYCADGQWHRQPVRVGRRQRLAQCHIEVDGIDPHSIVASNMPID